MSTLSIVPYPMLCQPLFVPRVWGGSRLADLFGKPLPQGEKIGESWEVADLPEGSSVIANGPLQGLTLTEAVKDHRSLILGESSQRSEFPLLIKFLDAHDDLSIQVHPDEETCRSHFPTERSKDETWVVVASQPGGKVLAGLEPGVTREDLATALDSGDVVDCLHAISVRPGDVLRLPPGTVHALCSGVVVLEIQEPSDSTFRLYDYNRLGLDGKPRELHREQALLSLRFNNIAHIKPLRETHPWGFSESLVATPTYSIERLHVRETFLSRRPTGVPQVLIVLSGEVMLSNEAQSIVAKMGDSVIVPASLGQLTCAPVKEACLIIATPRASR